MFQNWRNSHLEKIPKNIQKLVEGIHSSQKVPGLRIQNTEKMPKIYLHTWHHRLIQRNIYTSSGTSQSLK